MNKRYLILMLMGATLGFTPGQSTKAFADYVQVEESVDWMTNYQEALTRSKNEGKPIVLFFTGSDWCTWCHRLEREVFDTREFAGLAGQKYIFVKLDFPTRAFQEARIKDQNTSLQKKHNIKGYPTVVLIDHNETVLGEMGYEQGGGTSYAARMAKLSPIESFSNQKSITFESKPTFASLKNDYIKVKESGNQEEALRLAELGVTYDEEDFFLKESYSLFVMSGNVFSNKARLIREQLVDHDPDNKKGHQLYIARTEFEHLVQEKEAGRASAKSVADPLIAYINDFGGSDENQWRLEITVAEIFAEDNLLDEALMYANFAKTHAPSERVSVINDMIERIESKKVDEIALSDESSSEVVSE